MSTNAFGQLLSREQPIGFHNSLLRVYPAFSSIGLSHGLFVGRKKGRMRTPLLSRLTFWLCSLIQVLTCLR